MSDNASRSLRHPLPRLRIGSRLVTQKGVVFTVRDALVLVAENGAESLVVIVERAQGTQVTQLLLTVGKLANMTRGAIHKPGSGTRIDWARVPRGRQCDYPRLGFHQPLAVRQLSDTRWEPVEQSTTS
jgi:hypothetical protein